MIFKGQIDTSRANQGYTERAISGAFSLLKQMSFWQNITATGAQDVSLPDATTLPKGWAVVINAETGGNLTVKDGAGATLQAVAAGSTLPAYQFVLKDNSSAAGSWQIFTLENAGIVPATRYVLPHNSTTNWGAAAGGYYSIATTEATHKRGVNPMIQFYQDIGAGVLQQVQPDESTLQTSGNHSFRVPDDPDLRYGGSVVFI